MLDWEKCLIPTILETFQSTCRLPQSHQPRRMGQLGGTERGGTLRYIIVLETYLQLRHFF